MHKGITYPPKATSIYAKQLLEIYVAIGLTLFIMAQCIFCKREHQDETVEHIIPRTLGNMHYILPKGDVCGRCNNRFAKYEAQVLNSSIFLEERRRLNLLKPTNRTIPHTLQAQALHPFLLKMGYEGLYRSRKRLWNEFDLQVVRDRLVDGKIDPLFADSDLSNVIQSKSIPRWLNTFRLGRNHMKLLFSRTEDDRLFVHFQFGKIKSKVRMA